MKRFVDSMMSAISCGKDRYKLSAIAAATRGHSGLIALAMTSYGSAAIAVQTPSFKTARDFEEFATIMRRLRDHDAEHWT
jgi:hypothetical protein